MRGRLAVLFCHDLSCRGEHRWPTLCVVRIRGKKMHGFSLEQPLGNLPRPCSPRSREHGRCHLHSAAEFNPFEHALRRFLQDRIALRVSNDGRRARVEQVMEELQ